MYILSTCAGIAVGLATHYGLDGMGIEFRCGRYFPYQSRQALGAAPSAIHWVLVHSRGVNRSGRGFDHQPQFGAEVKERVEVYLYSPVDLYGLF
jgi:hypothetical protein